MIVDARMVGKDRVDARVGALYVTPEKERRALRAAGRAVVTASRKRVREQRDLDGRPFARRKRQTNRKTIRRIARHLRVAVQDGKAIVYIGSGRVGRIARQLQEGLRQTVTAGGADSAIAERGAALLADQNSRLSGRRSRQRMFQRGLSDHRGPMASRRQARSLQRWFRRTPQKRLQKWFTAKQAGYLIRKLEGAPAKTAWQVTIPARSFLGATATDRRHLGDLILRELQRGPRATR